MRHGWAGHGGRVTTGGGGCARRAARVRLHAARWRPAPRRRHMEVAVQDDPLFVGHRFYGRDEGLEARAPARRHADPGEPSLDAGHAGRARRSAHRSRRRARYDWGTYDELVAADRTGPKPRPVHPGRPRPGVGHRQQEDRRRQVKAKYYGGFVARRRATLQGPRRPLLVWNEPNYGGWLAPLEQAADLPLAVPRGLQRDQGGRPEREGPDRRDVALRDRAKASDAPRRSPSCAR